MPHDNVNNWDGKGKRPCDWCGHDLWPTQEFIHTHGPCDKCGRDCLKEETKFYIQLGYDGDSDVKPPRGYNIKIPK